MIDHSKFHSSNRDGNPFKNEQESKDQILETSGHYDSHRSDLINNMIGSTPVGGVEHIIFNNSSTSSSLGLA